MEAGGGHKDLVAVTFDVSVVLDLTGDTVHVGLLRPEQCLSGEHGGVVAMVDRGVSLEADFAGDPLLPGTVDGEGSDREGVSGEDVGHLGDWSEDAPVECPKSQQNNRSHF